MKTRDTAQQIVEKNINEVLELTEDIDKSTTVQTHSVEIFVLHDTVIEKFDEIKALDESLFSILINQDKSQMELDSRTEMLDIFQFISI